MNKGLIDEFAGLSLGDRRLDRRAVKIVERVTMAPGKSFPDLLPTPGELEGAYRFFQNETISPEKLLAPHVEATLRRVHAEDVVRIAHDTVALSYGGDRDGLGSMGAGGCGYYAQVSLAIGGDELRVPLGVVAVTSKAYPTQEEKALWPRDKNGRAKAFWSGVEKWSTAPLQLREQLKGTRAIHVMDREADNFELFRTLKRAKVRFVIRGAAERRAAPEGMHVGEHLDQAEFVLKRRVRLEGRPKPKQGWKLREERDALLSVRATTVKIQGNGETYKEHVQLNAVEVVELRTPAGEEKVSWILITNEPIGTPEEIAAVVDHYRARWRIEEYFKALKTGCGIEKRQLTTFGALRRALALFIPVAWQLLALRTAAQDEEPQPATKVLSPVQIVIARALVAERRHVLGDSPTAREVLLAIAALGGHLKRNGEPGWITLGRGFDKLKAAEDVWRVARADLERTM